MLTHLQTSEDTAVLQYRRAESGYRQYIYHHYLQIPESVREMLAGEWGEIAVRYGAANNLTLEQAQSYALIFLSRYFSEEGTPEDLELPLDNAAGTSYQYATVAAMTLRYFGIPARYAEGYVITEDMAAKFDGGETMTVDSSCAKAWVEVYQDGIGWIPMDLTPGMGNLMEKPDSNEPNSDSSATPDATEKEEDEEQDEQTNEEPEPNGSTVVTIILRKILKGLLIALPVVVVFFLSLLVRRMILLCRKKKKFHSLNCSDAVAWIYADCALILEKLGFDRGNGSMRDLRNALEERFGAEFVARFDHASDLNDRAMFSIREMDEENREMMMNFRSGILHLVKTEVKWYRRIWLRWGLCLY